MSAGLTALALLFISGLGYQRIVAQPYNKYFLRGLSSQEIGFICFFEGLKGMLWGGIFLLLVSYGLDLLGGPGNAIKKHTLEFIHQVDFYQNFVPKSWHNGIRSFHLAIAFYLFCLLVIFSSKLIRRAEFARKSDVDQIPELRECLEDHGSEFELLVADSLHSLARAEDTDDLSNLVLLLITLESNKVYVGYPIEFRANKEFEQIPIVPILSGFRHEETKKVYFTEEYSELYKAELGDEIEAGDGTELGGAGPTPKIGEDKGKPISESEHCSSDDEEEFLELQVCIPVERIVTMSTYDLSFAKGSKVPPPKSESKEAANPGQ